MNFTRGVEQRTIDLFLPWYNEHHGNTFQVVKHGDAPDFCCADESGSTLSVEITLMQERDGDIKALRGRTQAHSLEALREHLELVRLGKADPLDRVRSLAEDGVAAAVRAVVKKLTMAYGANTALVVSETCPLEWDWSLVADQLTTQLAGRRNPFDRGVWLVEDSGRIRRLL